MPAERLNTAVFFLMLSGIIISWLAAIRLIIRTRSASIDRRKAVLAKIIKIQYYLGTIYWVGNPEKESDHDRREKKKYRLFLNVRVGAVFYPMGALLFFILGIISLRDNLLWFEVFSCLLSPLVGLLALILWFEYTLMKDVDYFDKGLLPGDD